MTLACPRQILSGLLAFAVYCSYPNLPYLAQPTILFPNPPTGTQPRLTNPLFPTLFPTLTTLLYPKLPNPTQPIVLFTLPLPYIAQPALSSLAYFTLPSLPYLAQSTLHCQAAIPYPNPNLPFHTLSYLPSLAKPTQTLPQLSLPKPAQPSQPSLPYLGQLQSKIVFYSYVII